MCIYIYIYICIYQVGWGCPRHSATFMRSVRKKKEKNEKEIKAEVGQSLIIADWSGVRKGGGVM